MTDRPHYASHSERQSADGIPHQGAVGSVRIVVRGGRELVEKRMLDPARHDTEVLALCALAGGAMPVPELVEVEPGRILMTRMPGERLDSGDARSRLERLGASMVLLRRLDETAPPVALPPAPDDGRIVARYRAAGGPALPLRVPPPSGPAVFCHGDWTDGNVLAVGSRITAVVDWEAAHLGDPVREVSRAASGAARKDARSWDVMARAYGIEDAALRAWAPVHAPELWLWFAEAGPPEYLDALTADLQNWAG